MRLKYADKAPLLQSSSGSIMLTGGVCGVCGLFGDDYFKQDFTSKTLLILKKVLRAHGMLFPYKVGRKLMKFTGDPVNAVP